MFGDVEIFCGDIEDDYVKCILVLGIGDLIEIGGFVCEGCLDGKVIEDFEIKRFEFEDSDEYFKIIEYFGVIILYLLGEEGVFDMVYFDEVGGDMVGFGGICM